jgi:tetratricopeptide (TPR) repeat protein
VAQTQQHQQSAPDPDDISLLVRSFGWQSFFNRMLGNIESAAQTIRAGFVLLDRRPFEPQTLAAEKAFLLQQRGALVFESDREGSQRDFQASLEIYRQLGDRWRQAPVLNYLARIVFSQGKYREAIALLEESLVIYLDFGDFVGIATTQITLSNKLTAFGDFETMDAFVHKQAIRLRDLGNPALMAEYLKEDGINQLYLGRYTEAQKQMEAALDIFEDLDAKIFTNACGPCIGQ